MIDREEIKGLLLDALSENGIVGPDAREIVADQMELLEDVIDFDGNDFPEEL